MEQNHLTMQLTQLEMRQTIGCVGNINNLRNDIDNDYKFISLFLILENLTVEEIETMDLKIAYKYFLKEIELSTLEVNIESNNAMMYYETSRNGRDTAEQIFISPSKLGPFLNNTLKYLFKESSYSPSEERVLLRKIMSGRNQWYLLNAIAGLLTINFKKELELV